MNVNVLNKDYYHDEDASGIELFHSHNDATRKAEILIREEARSFVETYGDGAGDGRRMAEFLTGDVDIDEWNAFQRDLFEPILFLYITYERIQ